MKKIMVFIGVYLPGKKYGGPVTSIRNFTEALGDDYSVRIVTTNHDFCEREAYKDINEGWNRVGKADVLYLPDEGLSFENLKGLLEEERPDIIYASGVMNIKVNHGMFKAAKAVGIPILLAPRGDICDNAINIKRWKKIPFLTVSRITKLFDGMYFQATAEEERTNLKKYLKIPDDRIFLLQNISAEQVLKTDIKKNAGSLRAVFISRIHMKKNLLAAIQAVNAMTSEVTFDIFGPVEEEEYYEKCKEEMEKAPKNVKVSYKGMLKPGEAGEKFSEYDCFVFPTLTENYGHVIAEALMHDCPVVLSKGTTPWEDLESEGAGYLVELTDIEGYTAALEKIAALDGAEYKELVDRVRGYVDKKISLKDLRNKYKEMLEEIMQ